jgi:hypothetical protein
MARICTAMQTGQSWFSTDLKGEFESLKYPLYFMDFETVNPAIPRFVGMHPYDHIPFQFSVHVQQEPGAAPKHLEFLAMDNGDPPWPARCWRTLCSQQICICMTDRLLKCDPDRPALAILFCLMGIREFRFPDRESHSARQPKWIRSALRWFGGPQFASC